MGPRAGLKGCGKSGPLPGFDPRTVQLVASRYPGPPRIKDSIMTEIKEIRGHNTGQAVCREPLTEEVQL